MLEVEVEAVAFSVEDQLVSGVVVDETPGSAEMHIIPGVHLFAHREDILRCVAGHTEIHLAQLAAASGGRELHECGLTAVHLDLAIVHGVQFAGSNRIHILLKDMWPDYAFARAAVDQQSPAEVGPRPDAANLRLHRQGFLHRELVVLVVHAVQVGGRWCRASCNQWPRCRRVCRRFSTNHHDVFGLRSQFRCHSGEAVDRAALCCGDASHVASCDANTGANCGSRSR
mmetsp:Transcript_60295/g.97614  ORF Transcript_60295/g.97614 Transcript_60295/m.97614 type:complete len:228 (-) Transcript_60295:2370-3053(-)